MGKGRRRIVVLLIGVGATAAGWALFGSDTQPPGPKGSPPYLTLFLVDGVADHVFTEELAAGRLPHLQHMIEEGAYVERGISAFPSMTGYGYYGLLTGEDAVKSGVLGLRWFDRERERGNFRAYVGTTFGDMNRDLIPEIKSMYEEFADQHSFSLNTYNNRGAHINLKTGWLFTMAKYREHWWLAGLISAIPFLGKEVAPDWNIVEERVMQMAIDDLAHRPKFQWVTLVSPDTYSHIYGTGGRYPEILRNVDRLIGMYRKAAADAGMEDNRVYAVVSDHGVETATKNLDLREILQGAGVRAWRGDATALFRSEATDTLADYQDYDAIIAINGNFMNYVYLRQSKEAGWRKAPSYQDLRAYGEGRVDLVQLLREHEEISMVVTRDEDKTLVFSSNEAATIRRDGEQYIYEPVKGDPLGHGPASHTSDEWLALTKDGRYPYGVVRLQRLMSNPRAGDLVVLSSPGTELGKDFELFVHNYRGGHGGLRKKQMVVPYILAGPGVASGARIPVATNEDIGATLRRLMKLPDAPTRAGRILQQALEAQ